MARRLVVMEDPPMPVEDALTHLVGRLAKRRKDELRLRLESIDRDSDPEGYSQTMNELIALMERDPRSGEEPV